MGTRWVQPAVWPPSESVLILLGHSGGSAMWEMGFRYHQPFFIHARSMYQSLPPPLLYFSNFGEYCILTQRGRTHQERVSCRWVSLFLPPLGLWSGVIWDRTSIFLKTLFAKNAKKVPPPSFSCSFRDGAHSEPNTFNGTFGYENVKPKSSFKMEEVKAKWSYLRDSPGMMM